MPGPGYALIRVEPLTPIIDHSNWLRLHATMCQTNSTPGTHLHSTVQGGGGSFQIRNVWEKRDSWMQACHITPLTDPKVAGICLFVSSVSIFVSSYLSMYLLVFLALSI